MDLKALKEDLSYSAVMRSFFESAEDALAVYTDTFTELLDKHVPQHGKDGYHQAQHGTVH